MALLKRNKQIKDLKMYYVNHFDENKDLFQTQNISSKKNLEIFKENQVSSGETAIFYCDVTGELVEIFEKK